MSELKETYQKQVQKEWILELSNVLEKAPYLLSQGMVKDAKYVASSGGNSSSSSHSSNSSSHSASSGIRPTIDDKI